MIEGATIFTDFSLLTGLGLSYLTSEISSEFMKMEARVFKIDVEVS